MNGIPQPTIQRLFIYYRYLKKTLNNDGDDVICSHKLGKEVGTTSAQVRKDLSYFGEFGRKGVGYDVKGLMKSLQKIIGLNYSWKAVLVGAGNLGRALVNYEGFSKLGLNIVEVFDCDLDKIGNKVNSKIVKSSNEMGEVIKDKKIKIGILAIPEEDAQLTAEKMVEAGIKAIWCFSSGLLKLPDDIIIYYEDMASSVATLIYWLNQAPGPEHLNKVSLTKGRE
ncbi:MAG: redox-sensing transcriptional repressor Rex [Halothermotrichaceae bacterium]